MTADTTASPSGADDDRAFDIDPDGDAAAYIAVSLGLQHGVPLEEFVDAFTAAHFVGGSSNRRKYTHNHCFDNTLQFIDVFSRPRSSKLARRSPSAGRFRGLSVGSIRNPNRRSSIDSKYALDARAVSRLSFEPWMSNPRIRTP
jgi:hypothetical protein